MQERYNIFDKKEKGFVSKQAELKRYRKHIANTKWGTCYSYQSIKNISDEEVFFRQNYSTCFSIILRELNLGCDKLWLDVYCDLVQSVNWKRTDEKDFLLSLSKLLIEDVEMINGKPYVLRGGNYYQLKDTGNTFYVDEEGYLRKPKDNHSSGMIEGSKDNEWYLLKKDDNVWYKVVLKDSKDGRNVNHKDWVLEYLSREDLSGKALTVSSLSKKEKRRLLRGL